MRTENAARRPDRGFSLVELVVVLVIVSIVSAILLDRVKFYQEQAEKATMEATAAAIQAGLHLRLAGYLASGQERDVQRLATENPIDWLARKPESYAGALDRIAARELPGGTWYFDPTDRTVVYRIRYGRTFVADADGVKEVRFRANVDYGRLETGSNLMGIKRLEFVPVHPYRWPVE
jgi:prepilin-type N-terminal cleavage/methylation domain-containing protein